LRRDHPAERMSDDRRRVELQLLEQFVVKEHEVPEIIERAMCLGVAFAGAGMLGSIDGEIARQFVEEITPLQSGRPVEKGQCGARPCALDPRLYLVVPNVNDAFLNCGHIASAPSVRVTRSPTPAACADAGEQTV